MNNKKSKSKFTIFLLSCIVVFASVWAGRTYAYFTASSSATGTITMGTLKVNDFGEINANTSLKVVPNQTVTKNFKATIESDIKYYKRLSLTAKVDVVDGKSHETTCGDYVDDDTKILNATVQDFEKYENGDEIYYYSLAPVTPKDNKTEEEFTINIAVHDWVGNGGCDYYMGATIKVNVKVEVIQADYLEDNGLADVTTFTTASELHNVWTNILSPVQDVSEYPNLSFSILSEDDKTMSVSAANESITEANIPARVKKDDEMYSVTEIGGYAFYRCSNLTSLNIPNSVTSIGAAAFRYCSSLKSITIPNSVTEILYDTFHSCSSLESITIPDSVSNLGNNCLGFDTGIFRNCYNLKKVVLSNNVTSIPTNMFQGCINLTTMDIPNSVITVGVGAFSGCTNLNCNIFDNAKYLGNSTNPYLVCIGPVSTEITSCEIAESCRITSGSFKECVNLSFNKYDNAYYLGSASNPYMLLVKPTSTSITSCTINSNCKLIGYRAFYKCYKLPSIEIPLSVINITESFLTTDRSDSYYADSIDNITYSGTVDEFKDKNNPGSAGSSMERCYIVHCSDGDFELRFGTSCLYIDTEIDCWDEKRKRRYKKKLKDLTYDDDILVWDFDRGCFATAKAMFITKPQMAKAYTLTTFSDGTTLKTIGADDSKRHRLFNVDTGKFEYIGTNMKIGTRTFNSKGEIVTIVDMKFVHENIEYMNVLTKRHFNVFANGILTSNRFSNMYEIKDMKYVKTNKLKVENTLGIDDEIWKEMRLDEIVGTTYKIEEIGPHIADLQRMSKER